MEDLDEEGREENKRITRAEKHENFRRLAEGRVNKVLNYLRLIGNLANRRNYSYTNDEAEKILLILENEIKKLRLKFEPGQINFKL
jgi:hypothetical protein